MLAHILLIAHLAGGQAADLPVTASWLGVVTAVASTVLATAAVALARMLPRMWIDLRDLKREVMPDRETGYKGAREEIREIRDTVQAQTRASNRRHGTPNPG